MSLFVYSIQSTVLSGRVVECVSGRVFNGHQTNSVEPLSDQMITTPNSYQFDNVA